MTIKRRGEKEKTELEQIAEDVTEEAKDKGIRSNKKKLFRFDKVISTGSTLLDLSISGKKVRGGGLPGGIMGEIYGPSGSGKTSLLMEICASSQRKGGLAMVRDPESRLDKEYAEIYGVSIAEDFFDYSRPNTVLEMFQDLWGWEPPEEHINVFGADSIAALSTELEMEDWDKRGQKQAKDFSQGLRKSARIIGTPNKIIVFTNQLRQGELTEVTPGGKALEYYASVRIRVAQKGMIEKTVKLKSGKEIKKVIGIESECYIKKSTVDDPYRRCPLFIIFNYGVDDVRGNLQWYKDMMKDSVYDCADGKTYNSMDKAIQYIEENKLQKKLRSLVINLWEEIEAKFEQPRVPKVRF